MSSINARLPSLGSLRARQQMSSVAGGIRVRVDARALGAALKKLPLKLQKKIARKGLREWGRRVVTAIKRGVLPADTRMRRDAGMKIVSYKKGRLIWCAVGVRTDGQRVGWRSHMWDEGFRVWRKGTDQNGNPIVQGPKQKQRNPNPKFVPFSYNRGWRRNKARTGLGTKVVGRRMFITKARNAWLFKADDYVRDAVAEALRGI
jgi:hypothetical protein